MTKDEQLSKLLEGKKLYQTQCEKDNCKNYYNTHLCTKKELQFKTMRDCFEDFYNFNAIKETGIDGFKFMEWVFKENIIGKELTPEVLTLWKLARD